MQTATRKYPCGFPAITLESDDVIAQRNHDFRVYGSAFGRFFTEAEGHSKTLLSIVRAQGLPVTWNDVWIAMHERTDPSKNWCYACDESYLVLSAPYTNDDGERVQRYRCSHCGNTDIMPVFD